jgi:plasmid stabilization system protein ParE
MQDYEVVFAPTAEEDLRNILNWLEKEAPEKVSEWYAAIKAEISSLSRMPKRCPLAPENGLWGQDEVRQLLFQSYPSKYRVLFSVNQNVVQLLNIRHGARRYLHED